MSDDWTTEQQQAAITKVLTTARPRIEAKIDEAWERRDVGFLVLDPDAAIMNARGEDETTLALRELCAAEGWPLVALLPIGTITALLTQLGGEADVAQFQALLDARGTKEVPIMTCAGRGFALNFMQPVRRDSAGST